MKTKYTSRNFVPLKKHDERRLGTAKTFPWLRKWFLRNVGTFLAGLHNAVTQKATTKIFIVIRNSNPITYKRFQRLTEQTAPPHTAEVWTAKLLHKKNQTPLVLNRRKLVHTKVPGYSNSTPCRQVYGRQRFGGFAASIFRALRLLECLQRRR